MGTSSIAQADQSVTLQQNDTLQILMGTLRGLEAMMSNMPNGASVPSSVKMSGQSVGLTTITKDSSLDEEEMVLLMGRKRVERELKRKLYGFVTKKTFRRAKFPMGRNREVGECLKAVNSGDVELPTGVTAEVFANQFFMKVRKYISELVQMRY